MAKAIAWDMVPEPVHFTEATDFFRSKVDMPTKAWTDLRYGAHARSFSMAGATSMALLSDMRASLQKAMEDGTTLEEFRKDFDKHVEQHGWDYKGGRNWRSRLIFEVNINMAQAAGHWEQIQRLKESHPYLRYVIIDDDRTRDEHRVLLDIVLPVDHPFWSTHYPPNGWRCRCFVEMLTKRDLKSYGLSVSDDPDIVWENREVTLADGTKETVRTPTGIDTGFGYNVGHEWRVAVPMEMRSPLPPPETEGPPVALPPLKPRPLSSLLLPDGKPPEFYVQEFMSRFGGGIGQPVPFRDASGALLTLSDDLFRDGSGNWKVTKFGRHPHLARLAEALKDPDEIWADWMNISRGASPEYVLRKRYLRMIDEGNKKAGYLAFEWTPKGWAGVTGFPLDTHSYAEKMRRGALLYRKDGK